MRKKFIPWFVYVPWFVISLSLVVYVWLVYPETQWQLHFDRYALADVPWSLCCFASCWFIDIPLRKKAR